MTSYSYLFKTIIVGDTGVGKSCLLLQFTEKNFTHDHEATVGVGFGTETIRVDDKRVKLHLWDTAGQEKFRSITRTYYREAIAALLVYDVTRRDTFTHLASWLKDIKEQADPNVTVVLVGNKRDLTLRREVSSTEGERFAEANGLMFMEASAKLGQNVPEVFEEAVKSVVKKIGDGVFDLSDERCGIKRGDWENIINGRRSRVGGGSSSMAKCCGG